MPSSLFDPIRIGELTLPHRIAMAPLTRSRAGPGNVPTDMAVEYYRQRAGAALIITEATQISRQGQGYAWTPGIHDDAQIAGWRRVADAVHAEGGRIFMQLWHVGRVSHPTFQPGGALPVAPSALPVPGKTFIIDEAGEGVWADVPVPQALTVGGIERIVADYAQAARNAVANAMSVVSHAIDCSRSFDVATLEASASFGALTRRLLLWRAPRSRDGGPLPFAGTSRLRNY